MANGVHSLLVSSEVSWEAIPRVEDTSQPQVFQGVTGSEVWGALSTMSPQPPPSSHS